MTIGELTPEQRESAEQFKDQAGIHEPTKDADPDADRKKTCGAPVWYWYSGTSYIQFTMWCGNFRKCPKCRAKRIKEWTERLERIGDGVQCSLVTQKQLDELKGLLAGSSQYWVIPHKDTSADVDIVAIIVYRDPYYVLGKYPQAPVDIEKWIDAQPAGTRISGQLGRSIGDVRTRTQRKGDRYWGRLLCVTGEKVDGRMVKNIIEHTDLPSLDGLSPSEYHRQCQNAHIQALEQAGCHVKSYDREAALVTVKTKALTYVHITDDTRCANG